MEGLSSPAVGEGHRAATAQPGGADPTGGGGLGHRPAPTSGGVGSVAIDTRMSRADATEATAASPAIVASLVCVDGERSAVAADGGDRGRQAVGRGRPARRRRRRRRRRS